MAYTGVLEMARKASGETENVSVCDSNNPVKMK